MPALHRPLSPLSPLSLLSPRALLVALSLGLSGAVQAGPPPQVYALQDGITVEGKVEIGAPPDKVKALVRDPVATLRASGSNTLIKAGAKEGGCGLFTWTVTNPILNVEWVGRHCSTGAGGETKLVSSGDLEAHRASFVVEDLGGGRSRLVYQVLTVPKAPIPDAIIRRATIKEVTSFLSHLQMNLER
ncbi:MAG: hypothetical protein RL071_4549 [Pseudomonadota bacterium]|jgi:hypothetical protein